MPLGCGIGVGTPFIQSTGEPLPPFPWTPDFTPFQFQIQTDAAGNNGLGSGTTSIRLPFRPDVATRQSSLATGWAIDVDWGDGNTTSYTSFPATDYQVSHTYSMAGRYEISISMNAAATVNTLKGWSYGPSGTANANDSFKFLKVLNWGIFDFAADVIGDSTNQEDNNTANYFRDIENTEKWTPTFPPHISGTSLRGLWSGNYSPNTYNPTAEVWSCPYLDQWNTSSVQSLQETFYTIYNYNIVATKKQNWEKVNDWDVSNVTNMSRSFEQQDQLLGPEVVSWDTSSVTTMSNMFYSCKLFNGNINSWNVSSVTDMSSMFENAFDFNQSINSWNVSNVTTMGNMFYFALDFNQDLNSWDVSSVTNMQNMFRSTAYQGNISSWNTSNVTNMSFMFNGAFVNTDVSSWDTSSVNNMYGMFKGCRIFNYPVGSWNVSNVTIMTEMFDNAWVFNQPLNSWNTSNVTNMSNMFSRAFDFNQDLDNWDVSNVTNMGRYVSKR